MASLRMLRRANLFSRRRCCLSQLPATQLPCSFYVMVMRWSCNGFYDDPSPVIVLGDFTCWSLSTCGHYTSTCPLSTSTYTHVPMSTCSHIHMSIVYIHMSTYPHVHCLHVPMSTSTYLCFFPLLQSPLSWWWQWKPDMGRLLFICVFFLIYERCYQFLLNIINIYVFLPQTFSLLLLLCDRALLRLCCS